jgi:hypothetical protein
LGSWKIRNNGDEGLGCLQREVIMLHGGATSALSLASLASRLVPIVVHQTPRARYRRARAAYLRLL